MHLWLVDSVPGHSLRINKRIFIEEFLNFVFNFGGKYHARFSLHVTKLALKRILQSIEYFIKVNIYSSKYRKSRENFQNKINSLCHKLAEEAEKLLNTR